MAQDDQDCLTIVKTMRQKVNWEIEKEREDFARELYALIKNWSGRLPNLRDIFRKEEIDWLLTKSVIGSFTNLGKVFIGFVIRTGYKDEPDVDDSGNPLSRRTTTVHRAVRLGNYGYVDELFKIYDRFDVNYTDEYDLTHFHIACKFGCVDVVKKYLELGQDPNCLEQKSIPPLYFALCNNHKEVTELLLRSGADPSLTNAEGLTLLHIICKSSNNYSYEVAKKFLKINAELNQLVQVDAQDKLGNTPLLLALCNNHKEVAELLLRKGASPNLANAEGLTPLHVICMGFQNDDKLEMLFEICEERNQLVQIDAQDNLGNTPLHLALCYGKHWAAELLLRKGANPNLADVEGYTPLHVICKRDDLDYYKNVDLAELIFFKINKKKHRLVRVNAQDKLGHTPLYLALDNGYEKLAKFLLRKGANPNIANEDGSTPLHIICKKDNNDDLMDAFFEISDEKHQLVRIDARDNLGRTPLQWAVARFLPNTVEVLLNRGADLSKFAFPTESPYDVRYKTQPFKHNFQLRLAAGAMIVVELLEAKGYKLNQSDVLRVMQFFVKYELFDKSEELEKCWLDNEEFMSKAQKMMIKRHFSLYKLLGLRPKEAARQVSYWGYLKLAYSEVAWRLPEKSIQACNVHLCEKLSRGFFRQWSLHYFREMTRYRLPIECCEIIIDESFTNQDLYNICLAAAM
ncbi:ankyrin-3-like [Trichogramma pretiosum]|uniref:ankyrin-3-like n=1 Tax=Trichogramma pretiosum TaxID=7493 RepID=UPI0006C9899C|nr:ankyrin-3-like [Trichogramma pretiosum]